MEKEIKTCLIKEEKIMKMYNLSRYLSINIQHLFLTIVDAYYTTYQGVKQYMNSDNTDALTLDYLECLEKNGKNGNQCTSRNSHCIEIANTHKEQCSVILICDRSSNAIVPAKNSNRFQISFSLHKPDFTNLFHESGLDAIPKIFSAFESGK